ncbi:hypothetical protein F5051DRAFT_446740 [Lentinula edodes]|nr:hypothetical protein F5051DRAFT_446740 [Lentinula edodes]
MNNCKLTSSDYALRCMNVWEDPRVSNWIEQNREWFSALTFNEFFITICNHVLNHDWQDSTFRKMCAVCMPDDLTKSVSDLAVQLLVLNNLLQGIPCFQSEENLKMLLIDATDVGFHEALNKEVEDHAANLSHGIHSKDFDTFTKAIQLWDNGHHCQLLLARQMAKHMICSRPASHVILEYKRSSLPDWNTCPPRPPPASYYDTEHKFPLPVRNGFKKLTKNDVKMACKLRGTSTDNYKKPRTGTIASVGVIEEIVDDDIASITPSAVLGDGTDFKEEVTVPFRVSHLHWKCSISEPKCVFPITVNALIDNGAHLALIYPDLVERLGLQCQKLPSPEPICAAFQLSSQQSSVPPLTDFVLLKVGSLMVLSHLAMSCLWLLLNFVPNLSSVSLGSFITVL